MSEFMDVFPNMNRYTTMAFRISEKGHMSFTKPFLAAMTWERIVFQVSCEQSNYRQIRIREAKDGENAFALKKDGGINASAVWEELKARGLKGSACYILCAGDGLWIGELEKFPSSPIPKTAKRKKMPELKTLV